jgi:hypothetical protein
MLMYNSDIDVLNALRWRNNFQSFLAWNAIYTNQKSDSSKANYLACSFSTLDAIYQTDTTAPPHFV